MTDAQPTAQAPQTLGRYELLVPVARGGMGQVWAGRLRGARGFNKLVAIKTLLPMPGSEGRLESMLLEEARIAALIHHPNVVQTQELGEHEGSLYLVMEWVDGEPLSFVLNRAEERDGMPLSIAVNLVGQTLLGLHAAHELTDETGSLLGVVHRDVSPHNVLITYSGVCKLVDFGIAKATNQQSSVTDAGEVKGKFSYMAPEQIHSADVDRRADLFATGILLYTMTVGEHPFKSGSPAGVLHKITGDAPAPDPRTLVPDYPSELAAVVLKALAKDRDQRFASADEMFAALQQALPDAFAPDISTRVRDFMTELVGDRAALRREVLRRAQLIADSRTISVSSLAAMVPGTSQSASSLRALAIDSPVMEPTPQSSPSGRMTMPAPPRRSRGLLGLGLVAGALLAGALVLRTTGISEPRRAASQPRADMVELNTETRTPAAPSLPPPSELSKVPAEPSVAETPKPEASAASAVAAPAATSAKPSAPVAPAARKSAPAKRRSESSRNHELIAPDYAR